MSDRDLIHPDEVAKRYGITPETLGNWRRKHKGPQFVMLNKRRAMYRMADIIQWERKLQGKTP